MAIPANPLRRWQNDVGITQAAGLVTAWRDQVSGTFDLAPTAGGAEPAYDTVNKGPVFVAGKALRTVAGTETLTQPYTFAWCVIIPSHVSNTLYLMARQVNLEYTGFSAASTPLEFFALAGAFGVVANLPSYSSIVKRRIIAVFNGVNSALYIDSPVTPSDTGDAGTRNIALPRYGFNVNDQLSATTNNFTSLEFLVYARALDATERTDLDAYFQSLPVPVVPPIGTEIFTLRDANMGIGVSPNQQWRSGAPITGDGILLPRTIGQVPGADNFGNNSTNRQARLLQATANTAAGTDILPGWFSYINVVAGEWVWCINRTDVVANADNSIGQSAEVVYTA